MAKPIGTIGNIETLTVNGVTLVDLTNLIILGGAVTVSARYTTLRKMDGTAGYPVTAAKTFTVHAVDMHSNTSTILTAAALLYGDTDVGLSSASAPTTPVFPCDDANFEIAIYSGNNSSSSSIAKNIANVFFRVPAGKYLATKISTAAAQLIVYGYET